MSYKELFHIISKPWASINEIMLIVNCGRDTAIKIRNVITDELSKKGKTTPTGKTIQVPMKKVVDYLGLDENYIIEMVKKEELLNLIANNRAEVYASVSK